MDVETVTLMKYVVTSKIGENRKNETFLMAKTNNTVVQNTP